MRLPAGWWPRSQRHHNSTEDPPVTLALGDRGGWPSSVSFLMAVTITPMLASARKAMQIFRKNKLRRPSATVTSDQSPSRTVGRSPDQDFYIWETPSRWIAWPGNLARDCLFNLADSWQHFAVLGGSNALFLHGLPERQRRAFRGRDWRRTRGID